MTWIKICGMTNLEDALVAVDAGADAVGFVFYEKSPRNISVEAATKIVERLPAKIEKIGVFVLESESHPHEVVLAARLTGAQQYLIAEWPPQLDELRVRARSRKVPGIDCFPKPARFFAALPIAMLLDNENQVQRIVSGYAQMRKLSPELPAGIWDTYCLDSGTLKQPGGTGKTFDWPKAVPVVEELRRGGLKVVVAGGLSPNNVNDAIEVLHPWGVDVVSGVEASPGKKDPEKVRAFVRAVREADRRVV
jgi:phosphoribosylanthranilate isomerase